MYLFTQGRCDHYFNLVHQPACLGIRFSAGIAEVLCKWIRCFDFLVAAHVFIFSAGELHMLWQGLFRALSFVLHNLSYPNIESQMFSFVIFAFSEHGWHDFVASRHLLGRVGPCVGGCCFCWRSVYWSEIQKHLDQHLLGSVHGLFLTARCRLLR